MSCFSPVLLLAYVLWYMPLKIFLNSGQGEKSTLKYKVEKKSSYTRKDSRSTSIFILSMNVG
jgi:hypothetical protein